MLFHMLSDTKKQFTPSDAPVSNGTPTPGPHCGILCFSSSNYESMAKFLTVMGFTVTEGHDQLLPIFSTEGRAARIRRGDFEFNLEEDTSAQRVANFDMMLIDLSEDEINRAKASRPFKYEQSIYGQFYTFKSPDGGTFVITG